jgi:hypothetical protein
VQVDTPTSDALKNLKKKRGDKNTDQTVQHLLGKFDAEEDVEDELDATSDDENDGEHEFEEEEKKPGLQVMYEKDVRKNAKNLKYHTGLRRGAYF